MIFTIKKRNACIKRQAGYIKELKAIKAEISSKLNSLKCRDNWSDENLANIVVLEHKISKIEENENTRRLEEFKHFQCMSLERASKQYTKLLKNSKKSESINLIKDDDNLPFDNDSARNDYLVNTFKEKFSNNFDPNLSIEQFYGDLINHPLVEESKLSQDDRDRLENEISMLELDTALKRANFASAMGADGVPMKFLSKFWHFFRFPILHGFNYLIHNENEKLSAILRISRIKLIPKTNNPDLSLAPNWRPISLLCSLYKLLSSIFNLRLESVVDKITYRAQKGFSSKYCIQECLISTYETMNKAIKTNSSLCVQSLDFKSAFDVISHKYLKSLFKFINFGPFMLKFLDTIMSDRIAHIITECGFTSNFDLLSGVLQGNVPSPTKFRIGINPLIIKFTLNPYVALPPSITFKIEDGVDQPPDPTKGYADDTTNYIETKIEALINCKQILDDFANLSALQINSSKTKLCIVGRPASEEFINLGNQYGYTFCENFRLLGIDFDAKLNNMNSNIERCILKMNKIRNFFGLLNLTLPGKVNICKSFILPQINFIGSVLTLSQEHIETIENLICTFLNHNTTTIAKSKIFSEISEGGLGIPRISHYLKSLDVLLFRKSINIDDTWANELKNFATKGDKFYFQSNCDMNENPILHRIISSYIEFSNAFWLDYGHISDLRIYNNNFFTDAVGNKLVRGIFKVNTWEVHKAKITNLRFRDVVSNNRQLLSWHELRTKLGINLDEWECFRLNSIIANSYDKYVHSLHDMVSTIERFLLNPKNKSKDFRPYFRHNKPDITKIKTTKNRYLWANTTPVQFAREVYWQNVWKLNCITIDMRSFALKFFNNHEKYNANINHFDAEVSQNCTFCTGPDNLGAVKETKRHFFGTCNVTRDFAFEYFNTFLQNVDFNFEISWLLIGAPAHFSHNHIYIINIELIHFNFFLFKCRKMRKKPTILAFNNFMSWHRKILFRHNNYKIKFKSHKFPYDTG